MSTATLACRLQRLDFHTQFDEGRAELGLREIAAEINFEMMVGSEHRELEGNPEPLRLTSIDVQLPPNRFRAAAVKRLMTALIIFARGLATHEFGGSLLTSAEPRYWRTHQL
jgi:hypothetical protein